MSAAWPEPRWVPKDELAVVTTEGRVVIQDLDRLDLPPLVLEGTGRSVWGSVDGGRTTDEISQAVAVEYGITPEAIRDDVASFLRELSLAGIIEAR
jgi:hypothetical protein